MKASMLRTEMDDVMDAQFKIIRRLLDEGCDRDTVIDVIALIQQVLTVPKQPKRPPNHAAFAEALVQIVEKRKNRGDDVITLETTNEKTTS